MIIIIYSYWLLSSVAAYTACVPFMWIHKMYALSTEGIVSDAGKTYAFTVSRGKGSYTFHPVEVNTGKEENGYVELKLIDKQSLHAQFALNGAYYILSEMKKAETGEDD